MGIVSNFNDGGVTSNTIDRQFTPEFVTKAVVEMPARKRFFSNRSNKVAMPKHSGDTLTKEIRLPMLHKDNMVDGAVDATVASIIKNEYARVVSATGVVVQRYNAENYLAADGSVTLDEARTAARAAAVAALQAGEEVKSTAGSILNGAASYAISTGPLAVLPEEGGVVNLLNSSSKLVSAKVSFHGVATKYTVRSVDLDSRMGQVATKIKDLSRAVVELKEMQVQNSVLAAAELNMMPSTSNAAVIDMRDMDGLDTLSYDALTAFEQELQRDDVPMDTEILQGVDLVDTVTVEDAYIAYVNREAIPVLRNMTGPGSTLVWVPKSKYAAGTTLLEGEQGSIGSFRFVVVQDLQVYRGAGGAVGIAATAETAGAFIIGEEYTITSAGTTDFTLIGAADSVAGTVFIATGVGAGTGTATPTSGGDQADAVTQAAAFKTVNTSGTFYDVFPMVVVGDDSYSITGFGGESTAAKHIMPTADVHNDMYGEVGGVSAKWSYGFLAYRPERIKMLAYTATRTGKAVAA